MCAREIDRVRETNRKRVNNTHTQRDTKTERCEIYMRERERARDVRYIVRDKVIETNRSKDRQTDRQRERRGGGEREGARESERDMRYIVCAREIGRETKTDTGRELFRERDVRYIE